MTVSVEDAQQVIDTIFKMYPKLVPFFAACTRSACTWARVRVLVGWGSSG